MIKFFRKVRQNLLSEGKTGKYLKYAIGEIVLVVIGILIALQINNWNENRKNQKELYNIYNQIVFELDNDIQELTRNLAYYESLEPVFDKVMADSRSADLLDEGLSRLRATSPSTNLNTSGIQRLKAISVKDSLSLRLIELYELMQTVSIKPMEKRIGEEGAELANIYRDNYSWYTEWIRERITKDNGSKELQDYFVHSKQYQHFVVSNYQKVYNNYVPTLKTSLVELRAIRDAIKNTIEK